MTLPTVPVESGVYAPTNYAFTLRGSALPVAVDDAVTDFINVIKPYYDAQVTFQDAIVYSQPAPTDVPLPVASFTLGIVGTNGTPGWDKATQATLTFRADDFTIFKLVLLDSASSNVWDKVTNRLATTALEDLTDYIMADVTFLASRGGGRPATFLQMSTTLNEKLRRSYNMT
jgi:hypothetical protein